MKKAVMLVVLLVVLSSTIVYAAEETSGSCSGFWGSIKCFLWGNPSNRAGQSWWARGEALVGN